MRTRNEDFHNKKKIPPEMVVTYSSKKQEKQKAENEIFVWECILGIVYP